MPDRYDAMVARKRGDKTYWCRIGAAFPNKNGPGFTVLLDALPIPDADGRCAVSLFPPREKDNKPTDHQAPLNNDPNDSPF